MIKKEEHMRSQPSNVITWTIPIVLAAVLACSLVMPLNAQTRSSQKGPAQAPPKSFDNPQQAAEALSRQRKPMMFLSCSTSWGRMARTSLFQQIRFVIRTLLLPLPPRLTKRIW